MDIPIRIGRERGTDPRHAPDHCVYRRYACDRQSDGSTCPWMIEKEQNNTSPDQYGKHGHDIHIGDIVTIG